MKTDNVSSSLRILMLAPEPFFQPRGTPISIYFRLKALSDLGHKVDLVTYPLGEDKEFDNLRILRIPNLMGIRHIRIGPSLAKIPLDIILFGKALGMILRRRYDLVFSHEEAGWFGILLAALKKMPHIYDMHSSLPQQLENFRFTRSKIIIGIFRWLERRVLKRSGSVIVICPDLFQLVEKEGYGKKTLLLENFIDFDRTKITDEEISAQKKIYAADGRKVVLYVGNFQSYQGIPLFFEAAVRLKDKPVVFLLVGGKGRELEEMRERADAMGLEGTVYFTGQVPPSRVPVYIQMADALVSPRTAGSNTPLKIYSFLKSGKPVVATRLWTHTQVLDDSIALLVEPEPHSLARGIERALFQVDGQRVADAAKLHADKNFTYSRYRDILSRVLEKAFHEEGGDS